MNQKCIYHDFRWDKQYLMPTKEASIKTSKTKSEIAPNILTSFAWFQNHEDGKIYMWGQGIPIHIF